MPQGLRRFHHTGQSHFITFTCYHRLAKLDTGVVCPAGGLEVQQRWLWRTEVLVFGGAQL